MVILKDRNKQIPGGLRFIEPSTGWESRPWSSFDCIVQQIQAHRKANPSLQDRTKWRLDAQSIANELDVFNATLCQKLGFTEYIQEGGFSDRPFSIGAVHPPPSMTLLQQSQALVAGVASISQMFGAEGPVTDKDQVERRAAVCAACPLNTHGDWLSWFTKPASEFIRKALSKIKDQGLVTTKDDVLDVCSACSCPLRLKVWTRLDHVLKHIPEESKTALAENCWIRTEQNAKP